MIYRVLYTMRRNGMDLKVPLEQIVTANTPAGAKAKIKDDLLVKGFELGTIASIKREEGGKDSA